MKWCHELIYYMQYDGTNLLRYLEFVSVQKVS